MLFSISIKAGVVIKPECNFLKQISTNRGLRIFCFFWFSERAFVMDTMCLTMVKIYIWPCSFFINKRPEALYKQVLKDV